MPNLIGGSKKAVKKDDGTYVWEWLEWRKLGLHAGLYEANDAELLGNNSTLLGFKWHFGLYGPGTLGSFIDCGN